MPGQLTVACKLPHGLILRLHRAEDRDEPVMGGGYRTVKAYVPTGAQVTIKGSAHRVDAAPGAPIVGGFALTHNVDADFFGEWLKQNAEHDAVKSGLVFAHVKSDVVEAQAREKTALRSGLEPINPNKLPKGIEAPAKAAA